MTRTSALAGRLFILSLLLSPGLNQQVNGQQREPRKLFPVDGNSAFIDVSGRVVISGSQPALLEEVRRVSAPLGGFRGFDSEPPRVRFDEFSEGLAVASWSLCPSCRGVTVVNAIVDETGRMVIPPKGLRMRYGSFHEGLARYVESAGGVGFIDRTGRVIIPAGYYEVSDFSEGLAYLRRRVFYPSREITKFGFIDRQGNLVIPYHFEWVSDFHEGLAAVRLSKSQYGFIDKTGKLILHATEWLGVEDFSEGLAAVKVLVADDTVYRGYQEERYGYINRSGRFVIAPRFNRAWKFSEGSALFFQQGQKHGYGFIDSSGRVVIKPEYAGAKSFSEGLAAVAVKSSGEKVLWGYIDREGRWVIKPQYSNANSFDGGLAAVNCDEYGRGCKAYVDREGKIVWPKL